jgi:hypothetical protein
MEQTDRPNRQNFLEAFLGDERNLIYDLDLDGSHSKFIGNLVDKCIAYGKIQNTSALLYFLNSLRNSQIIGLQKQDELVNLINYAYALTTYHIIIFSNNNDYRPFNDTFLSIKNKIIRRYVNEGREYTQDFDIPDSSCFLYSCNSISTLYDIITSHFGLTKLLTILFDCNLLRAENNDECICNIIKMTDDLIQNYEILMLSIGITFDAEDSITDKIQKNLFIMQNLRNEEELYHLLIRRYLYTKKFERMQNLGDIHIRKKESSRYD